MSDNMKVFVGMVKGTNMFLMGQVVEKNPSEGLILKSVVRVFEVPTADKRIGYQFHPDPYFTADVESFVSKDEFLILRVESNPDDKMVKEYGNFLTSLRMQNLGLVPGALNPDKAKQILRDTK